MFDPYPTPTREQLLAGVSFRPTRARIELLHREQALCLLATVRPADLVDTVRVYVDAETAGWVASLQDMPRPDTPAWPAWHAAAVTILDNAAALLPVDRPQTRSFDTPEDVYRAVLGC